PEPTIADFRPAAAGAPDSGAPQAIVAGALEQIQAWLAADPAPECSLVLLSEGAMAVREGESPHPASAALCGLVRSAHSEHPGRFALIDTDGSEASEGVLQAALAASSEEPQLALREGEILAPRLTRAKLGQEGAAAAFDPERTILLTGATGGIGALLARHLVKEHGARQLLLASRSGPRAKGAAELQAELEELGATVAISACDVSDRAQLQALLAAIPAEHPLGAVIHAAAVIEDGTLERLDAGQLQRVFAPKAEAAWHLHELTRELDLSHFILFSSLAGLLGGPGQANYAAANAFLDALAVQRRAEGLSGISMAWGLWGSEGMAAAGLDRDQLADLIRRAGQRLGLVPMAVEHALDLFDAGLGQAEALLVTAQLDLAVLRAQSRSGVAAPVLRDLFPDGERQARERGSMRRLLAEAPERERAGVALNLVCGHVAAVLGHGSASAVEPQKAFKELGFDSLAAVELRNRLSSASGLRLSPSLAFDHPTPAAMADYLMAELAPGTPSPAGNGAKDEDARVRQLLEAIPISRLRAAGLLEALLELDRADHPGEPDSSTPLERIDAMDIGELVQQTLREQPVGGGG
ncbi:MAG TPA: beta-ketoacyl reductase, partial [Solirubrobacterales bacterium]